MPETSTHRWCLLIHHLPARPLYLRARVRRLLAGAGAAPLKRSVYVLPASPAALERLRGIADGIAERGGTAYVCEAAFPDPAAERAVIRDLPGGSHLVVAPYASSS